MVPTSPRFWFCVAAACASIREGLRVVAGLARVDFEEAFAIVAVAGAVGATADLERVRFGHAETVLAVPTARRFVGGVEVVVAGIEGAREKRGAAFWRHRPPALAQPLRAVEASERHFGCMRRTV